MKNNISNKRLLQLILFEWQVNRKRYLWSYLAAFGFVAFVFIITMFTREGDDSSLWTEDQIFIFFPLLWGIGSLVTHAGFLELSRKESAISYMMIPAAPAEKILVKWFFTGLLFTIAFLFFFMIVSHIGFAWFRAHYDPSEDFHAWKNEAEKIRPLSMFSAEVAWSVAGYLLINAALLLGTVYVRRFVYIKTAMALFSVVYLVALFIAFSPKVIFGDEHQIWNNGFFQFRFTEKQNTAGGTQGQQYIDVYLLELPKTIQFIYFIICCFALPLLLNILACKKLQKKEI